MEFLAIVILIYAGILIYVAWSNERWRKKAHQDTLALLEKMKARQKETRKEVAEARKENG